MTASLLSRVLPGAACGVLATVPMSAVMLGSRRAGLMPELPPKLLARQLLPGGGPHVPRRGEGVATALAHLGFGATAGAGYTSLVPVRWTGAGTGAAWGLAVWGVSYEGWVPAVGAEPPAHRDDVGRTVTMVLAHVVFGAVLGASVRRRQDRGEQSRPRH